MSTVRPGKSRFPMKHPKLIHKAELGELYDNSVSKSGLCNAFNKKVDYNLDGCEVFHDPFTCCVLPNFVSNKRFLDELYEELSIIKYHPKNNDLFKFKQSDDLRNLNLPHSKELCRYLYEDVRPFLSEITGISLEGEVSVTSSRYEYTDVLLCHDDELEGRRIAFILYLVPQWSLSNGGSLDLFSIDENNQPKNIVKSIVPSWNTFTFFEVTVASHHQVSEIVTEDKCRLSISGWFHGVTVPRCTPYCEPPLPRVPYSGFEKIVFHEWINPIYLDVTMMGEIQEKFETASEIELPTFLAEEKFVAVTEALKSDEIRWIWRGPWNKRHYQCADPDSLPEILVDCLDFLSCDSFFLTLSNLTGLRLHEMAPTTSSSSNESSSEESEGDSSEQSEGAASPVKRRRMTGRATCTREIRRWSVGSYTLAHDSDSSNILALDASLFFACSAWSHHSGGFTTYIAHDEEEELLTVYPIENSIALVYREKDTTKFVKHCNSKMKTPFYDFSLVYYER